MVVKADHQKHAWITNGSKSRDLNKYDITLLYDYQVNKNSPGGKWAETTLLLMLKRGSPVKKFSGEKKGKAGSILDNTEGTLLDMRLEDFVSVLDSGISLLIITWNIQQQ